MAKTQKPATLSGGKTRSETNLWESMVAAVEGINYPFFFHDAYEFAKKRFKEDDNSGVYNDNPN